MQFRTLPVLALTALLVVGTASAVTVSVSDGPGTYTVGDSFTIKASFTFDCFEEQSLEPVDYTATLKDAPEWIDVNETTVTFNPQEQCGPDPEAQALAATVSDIEIPVNVTGLAPAFTDVELEVVLKDKESSGGNFTIQQEYVPAFTVPSGLSFDVADGGATASIPLTVRANADSVFSFEVTSFTFDGEAAPASATAHIQESLEVASPLKDGETAATHTVDLHFGDHGDHSEGDDHDDMAMENGTDAATEMEHFHWSNATAVVSVILAAKEDGNLTSEPQVVTLSFANTNEETQPHSDDDGSGDEGDEGGLFTPGHEVVVALAALGAVAALARRRD